MENITLNTTLRDINISKTVPAFLRYMPMPQIPDPAWDGEGEQPMVDEYPNVKTWAEAAGRDKFYLVCIQRGQRLLDQDAAAAQLTADEIFVID